MHRVLRPGGRLLLIDGNRDSLWGWFIYDVCVAGIEGDVLHASARRLRMLFEQAGLLAIAQKVHHGPAPFLLTEAVAAEPVSALPAPLCTSAWSPPLRAARPSPETNEAGRRAGDHETSPTRERGESPRRFSRSRVGLISWPPPSSFFPLQRFRVRPSSFFFRATPGHSRAPPNFGPLLVGSPWVPENVDRRPGVDGV